MKRLIHLFAVIALSLGVLAGCAQLGVPAPETMPQRIAVGLSNVTQVRKAAVILLKADKISVRDAENIQAQADNAATALNIARVIAVDDPAGANAKVSSAIAVLTALDAYLATKEPAK